MKRKLLSILLCLAMALSLLPTAALADEGETGTTGTTITTSEALVAAIANAQDGATITLGEGTFTTYGNASPNKSLTFVGAGADKTVWKIGNIPDLNNVGEYNGDYSFDGCNTITFKNMKMVNGVADYLGFIRISNSNFENCIFEGRGSYWGYETAKFTGCTFNAPGEDYALWDYSSKSMTFDGCTFNISGKGVNVYVEAGNAGSDARTVTVKDCTVNSTKENKAFLNIKNSTQAYEVEITGNNTVSGLNADTTTGSNLYQVETTTVTETSGKPVKIQEKAADGTLTTVYEVKAPAVAKVGGEEFTSLTEAFAALNSNNYTLELLVDNAWDAAKPVYWKAGDQSEYAATLAAALTAAYKAGPSGDITIVCRPGADVGTMTHGHVADNLTIYGNNAFISGGECDLEVDTYKFSRTTGAQASDGEALNKDITITAYELDNLSVWGQRNTAHKVTVNLTDCDGKEITGKTNVQRVYISGTTGVNDITLTDCDFLTNNTSVYSNADGSIMINNCSFTGGQVPVNFNHKANGTQTVTVKNSKFENCGDNNSWKQFAAPVRFVNSGTGTMVTSVIGATFTDTVGDNGDILLGDGRKGESSNDVTLTVSDTNGKVVAQRPGYYNGDATASGKRADAAVKSGDSPLVTTLNKLLPVKNEIDLDEFLAMVKSAGYNFDGAAVTGNGSNLVVKWSPVSGCFDTRAGHTCKVNGEKATGNTPTYINSKLAQYFEFNGQENVTIKNVNFVYVADNFTICANNNGISKGWTKEEIKTAQLYLRNSGNTTIEGCSFDNVVFTSFDNTGTTVIKNSAFKNIYGSYAIKDLGGSSVEVSDCTFENCGGGIMLDSNSGRNVTPNPVTISDNTFTKVDVAGTTPEDKVGTRGLLQIPSKGDYANTAIILDGNDSENCGPILRQMNQKIADEEILSKNLSGDLAGLGGELTFTNNSVKKTPGEEPSQPTITIYTVKFSGSDVADMKVVSGTEITLPTATKSGYTFKGWMLGTETKNADDKVTISSDTTFTAVWQSNSSSSGSSGSSTSVITTPSKTENGTVTVSPKSASKGDTVTITVKPDSGYVLDDLTVTDKNGNELKLTDKGNGKYTFTMPAGKVEVKASFAKEVETSPFADVATDAYYYEAVKWAVKNGITDGVGNDLFAPGQPCTRAQIVTFLWRAAGSPEPKGTAAGMTDVVSGSYYEKAVAWAIENGVTTGTTATTFSPDATCTRAQAVTFLARALNAKASGAAEFSDVPTNSYFADAVAWAASNGVTEGVGNGMFAPDNDCTRGQIVTFLYRAYNK